MVKPLKPIGSYTTSTYQSFDGSNFTLTGLEEKFKGEKGYVSTFWAEQQILKMMPCSFWI